MALYRVMLPNPYFKVGQFVEDDDEGMVQRIEVATRDGRLQRGRFVGLCFPIHDVRYALLRMSKRGLDENIRKIRAY